MAFDAIRGSARDLLAVRREGGSVRDTVLVLDEHGRAATIALVARGVRSEYVQNAVEGRAAAMNLVACRVGGPDGRWPTNLLLVHGTSCRPDDCVRGCPAAMLDRQSGPRVVSAHARSGKTSTAISANFRGELVRIGHGRTHNDEGGAARWFPRLKAGEVDAWLKRLLGGL